MNDLKENTMPEEASAASQKEAAGTKKKDPKMSLKAAISVFFAMLAVIICLSAATIVLAIRVSRTDDIQAETEPAAEAFVPIVNNRVYDFYDEGTSILFDDPTYGEIWLPAFTNVPRHTYDYSGLVLENGRYTYSEDENVVSRTGIDVSYHQGDIDWNKVAADGIDFAIIRVGYRGYESGLLNLDSKFHTYMKGALNAGLDVGVYFYSQAVSAEEAIEEANFVMEQIHGYDVAFPVVFDWEITDSEMARTNGIAVHTVTECAAAFCDTISDGGYIPMLYGSRKFALMKLDMSRLGNVDFWFAEYKDGHMEPSYPYDFQIWQYASDGRVNGVNGDVDLNICFVNYGNYGASDEDLT